MSSPSLAYLDLVFCVDVTSSMTPFIVAARAHMAQVLDALRDHPDVDLRVAIVTYRDHGSMNVVDVHPFSEVSEDTRRLLEALTVGSPPENTDSAEAVFSGLVACIGLPWRAGAYRLVVLVGDAPPHACGATAPPYPDRFPDRDPTGLTLDDMANRLEEAGIFVHALAMIPSLNRHHDPFLERAFQRLGIGTGGAYHTANTGDAAMHVVDSISKRCLVHLEFDRQLHELLPRDGTEPDAEALATQLAATVTDVYAGLMRLRQRRLL
jgi:hypothetical protein